MQATRRLLQATQRPELASLARNGGVHVSNRSVLNKKDFFKSPAGSRARNIVIEVPSTALPTDVLRALKEARVVGPEFPLSRLTPPPVGSARNAGLTAQFHISAKDEQAAMEMFETISSRPLFAASSKRAGPAPPRPDKGEFGVREPSMVGFSVMSGKQWADSHLQRAAQQADMFSRKDPKNKGIPWQKIDVEWATSPSLSGRRVVLRGLPFTLEAHWLHELADGLADPSDDKSVVRIPPKRFTDVSSWIITCPTVARAHTLQRRLHCNFYSESRFGTSFPMQAHIVY